MKTKQIAQMRTRESIILELYEEAFPEAAVFVRKMGGSLNDAKDIFHDALVIYYEQKLTLGFTPEQGHKVYLSGIVKNLWYKNYQKSKLIEPLADNMLFADDSPKVSIRLMRFLELSGKRCMELLSAFYFEKMPLADLVERFGFSGVRSATVQKFKCVTKLREAVRERTLKQEDFYE